MYPNKSLCRLALINRGSGRGDRSPGGRKGLFCPQGAHSQGVPARYPASPALERGYYPGKTEIVAAVRRVMNRQSTH